jgi:peptide-methionine (S)-S-oxide reductase
VIRTTVGYSGGRKASPTYRSIGDHSEVIRVEYNPKQVSYRNLLEVFWESHDPGYDAYLRQYRNAIFYLNEQQRHDAQGSLDRIKAASRGPVHTVVESAGQFYPAEDYHQKYLLRRAAGLLHEYQSIYPDAKDFAASTATARVNGYLGCYGDPAVLKNELPDLGLSPRLQALLVEHVTTNCLGFTGLTCPAPNRAE